MTRLIIVSTLLVGCDHVLGIPDLQGGPGDGSLGDVVSSDASDIETSCNYVDDDADGLVDEGYVYVEQPAARHVVDSGAYAGLFWLARSADRIAATWITGDGTAGDIVSLQVYDLMGTPVASKVTTAFDQPWTMDRGFWIGDEFVIAATQRSYACGGSSSTTCNTYLLAVDRTGTMVLGPTHIATDGPYVAGAYTDQGNYVAAFPGTGAGSIRIAAFTAAGTAAGTMAELFATAPGEAIVAEGIRAVVDNGRAYWTYSSSTTGFTLRVTDLAGQPIMGPVTLSTDDIATAQRGSAHALVVDGALVVPLHHRVGADIGGAVGRWTLDGHPLGMTELPGTTDALSIAATDDQLYVLATAPDAQNIPHFQLWRLSRDARVIQAGVELPLAENPKYAAVIDSPAGAVIGASVAAAGSHPVTITRLGCPPP